MTWGNKRLCLIAGILIWSAVATRADSVIDGIEHIFGATNINAITGHGRLSAGVSVDGDLTVLTWPSPSFADQLSYLSSNDIHARSLPRLGASDGAGSFLGLVLDTATGREVSWFRDRTRWSSEQSYGEDDGPNIVTRFHAPSFGLSVTVTDAVQPPEDGADVLVRLVDVVRSPSSPVRAAWLLAYANLSPTPPNSRIPELPVIDWLFDGSNDFAAVWDAAAGAVVHFHPRDRLVFDKLLDLVSPPSVTYGSVGDILQTGTPDGAALAQLAAALDDDYAAGAYVAVTTRPPPDAHQIGYDATPLCAMRDTLADNIFRLPEVFPQIGLPIDPGFIDFFRCRPGAPIPQREGWTHVAADALLDAADGELEGSGVAAGEVNEALRTPLVFDADGHAQAALLIGFGSTATEARQAVASVADPAGVVAAADTLVQGWLATLHLPETAPAEVRVVARRSLINLRVGTDRRTGAIVASIARQPPYGLDWPRDGAFFNVALDISGQSTLVDRRIDLYDSWQRRMPAAPTVLIDQEPPVDPRTGEAKTYPAGAWEMNYYPDGMTGGVFRFEIDNAAFVLWSTVSHAGWQAEGSAPAYLRRHWESITRTADLLAAWRDPATGLQAPASEDDNGAYTQTLHGAVTVFGALDLAGRAARLLGNDVQAGRWEARACELRQATLDLLHDDAAGRFVSAGGDVFEPSRAPTGQTAWLVWPMRLLPWDDPRVDEQLRGDLDLIRPRVDLETDGGAYFMKNTVALAVARGSDPVLGPRIAALRDRLARDHATPLTHHFGEAMVVVHDDDGAHASQRVANPHLWEGVLFYLTAVGMDDPGAFDRYEQVLPPSRLPPVGEPCPQSVTCAGDCNGDGEVTVDELVLGVGTALGEIPGSACPALDTSGDGRVTVDELTAAINSALRGCGG